MDSRQLLSILRAHLPNTFLGVCAEDELKSMPKRRPCAIIVNTDPSTEDGTHWTAIHLTNNLTGEFFDSSGEEPDDPVRLFMNQQAPAGWEYNCRRVQGPLSTLCGAYCLQYLEKRSNSRDSFSSILFKLFPFKNNDELVRQRMRDHYGLELSIYDYSFLLSRFNKK